MDKNFQRMEQEMINEFVGIVTDFVGVEDIATQEQLDTLISSLVKFNKICEVWPACKARYSKLVLIRIQKNCIPKR